MQIDRFNVQQRCVMNIGNAVAEEVMNGYAMGYDIGRFDWSFWHRPTLMKMSTYPYMAEYADGTIVYPDIIDISKYDDRIENDFETPKPYFLVGCKILFKDQKTKPLDKVEVVHKWGFEELLLLSHHRQWGYPVLESIDKLIEAYPDFARQREEHVIKERLDWARHDRVSGKVTE